MSSHFRLVTRWGLGLILLLLVAAAAAPAALAHPLGNFTINHYSRLEPADNEIRIRFVLDMAEIPTFQERQVIDLDGNGVLSDDERARYLAARVAQIAEKLSLTLNSGSVKLTPVPGSAEIEFPEGQGGLPTLRLSAWFAAPLSLAPTQTVQLKYRDDNYADRIGWREMVVRAPDKVALIQSNLSSVETTDELRHYPQDLLAQPLDQREADLSLRLSAAETRSSGQQPERAVSYVALDRTRDAFADLIAARELSLPVILISLMTALLLGGLHAFSPGHGKTIVGAYLVGARGTARHALALGLVVTATHTAGVYALGLITLVASQYIVPETLYPWLGVVSGLLVALIGGRLFISRLGGARARNQHAHEHPHSHSHGDAYSHSHEEDELKHARAHIPAVLQGAPLTWRSLVSLGISGGLLPCPSALVVLLSAIALGRVAFGLVLIVAFSLGLAGVLTLTGVALLYVGRLASRLFRGGRLDSWLLRGLPVASALIVTLLGAGIAAEAFLQTGIVK